MSSNLHRNSTEANKHTPKGFDLANNNSTLLRDERGQSRYVDNLVQERAENLVNGNSAPPTTTEGHVYVLIDSGSGAVNAGWQGASYNDVVRIQGGVWSAITPVSGYLVFNKTDGKYYAFNGSSWVQFIPDSQNIYTNNGTTGSNRTVTITDVLNFNGGKVALNSTTAGFLMPRVTTLQMNGIATPSTNELVFNTDLNGMYRYNGSAWVALSSGYGIIGVYSGSGNGTPVFFADLQSALETCKASGGYFTVKLYSNITITSAIQIEYTGSGVGNAYQFRQLTIDFNGFSVTNAQANTSEVFDVRLSNSASVYQEIKFINGGVFRTNGTGTHHALKINQAGRYGTVQMSNMFWYCQNSFAMDVNLATNSTAIGINKVCNLGGSTFVSQTATAVNSNTSKVINFNAIAHGSTFAVSGASGELQNFTVENTSSGIALGVAGTIVCRRFDALSNSGNAVNITNGTLSNFNAKSVTGIALNVSTPTAVNINEFEAETSNNYAVFVLGENINISNGKAVNNSATDCVYLANFGSANNIEGLNNGSGVGMLIGANQNTRNEAVNCKGHSIGGIGGLFSVPDASATININGCEFVSFLNSSSGHAVTVTNSVGKILFVNSFLKVRNSGANAIHATATRTVHSRYVTHNDVATTPINANVTIVSSGIIS